MTRSASLSSVSLIIPTYNSGKYLAEAIDSALAQTLPFAQIVVVDDGSQDDTAQVLDQYGDQIDVIRQTNQGVSVARNNGMAAATGEIFAFLDADDVLLPDRLEQHLAAFEAHPEAQISDAFSEYFWCPKMSMASRKADHRFGEKFWQQSYPGHISTWLVRRAVFDSVGVFEPGCAFSEDTDWRLRTQAAGIVQHRFDGTLAQRRLHPENVTNSDRSKVASGLMRAIWRHRQRTAHKDAI